MSKRLGKIAARNLYKPGKRIPESGKPFALIDKVASKSEAKGAATCLGEMSVLLDCWKGNNFSDAACAKEIVSFNTCVTDARAVKGSTTQGLTSKEANVILKNNPLPRS